jgi:predicted nuclease with TOPRIM domain
VGTRKVEGVNGTLLDTVLGKIKRWLGLVDEAEGYEREALEREYRRLERKIQKQQRELDDTPTAKSKKKQNPKAKKLLGKIRKLRDRQKEIEAKLGGSPDTGGSRSRRG